MGTLKMFVFNSVSMGSVVYDFLHQKLIFSLTVLWVSVSIYLIPLFGFVSKFFFSHGFRKNGGSTESNNEESNFIELDEKQDFVDFSDKEINLSGETEVPEFSFQFKFPTYEEFSKSGRIFEDFVSLDTGDSSGSVSKYEVVSEKSFIGFVDEPEVVSCEINEVGTDLNHELLYKDLKTVDFEEEEEDVHEETTEKSCDEICGEVGNKKIAAILDVGTYSINEALLYKDLKTADFDEEVEEEAVHVKTEEKSRGEDGSEKIGAILDVRTDLNHETLLDKDLNTADFDEEVKEEAVHVETAEKSHGEDKSEKIGAISEVRTDVNHETLLDKDLKTAGFDKEEEVDHEETAKKAFEEVYGEDENENIGALLEEKGKDFEDVEVHTERDSLSVDSDMDHFYSVMSGLVDSFGDGFLSDADFGGEFDPDNPVENMDEMDMSDSEEAELENPIFLSETDFYEEKGKEKSGEYVGKNHSFSDQKREGKKSTVMDTDDTKKMESLWEHQELIEQLKMELKKVRATGLPTIFEESESPKIMEDLKPWKIEDKYQRGDRMGDLHKFYKSYRERMRKFDILNYQKMYAIGFLQLKDPLKSFPSTKSPAREITTLLSQSFSASKGKKHENEPTMKFVKELHSELEVVYVGQMCLSWEILYWQYEKALDIWESDPRLIYRFNQVAGEFQQFQVLVQRFVEDEPFEGPRVQNYIKNRCILRNLLQVPIIKEDSSKNRSNNARKIERGEYDITSDKLVDIMEESIRIFWRFVRGDKDSTKPIMIGRKGPLAEFQDPGDSQLFMEVHKDLQKKERKLKDTLRSGNCILRKFQKCRGDDSSDQVLYFFSQVDMRLVSRVLHLSKITTDQLIWCRNKLSKISFVNRKISVEPTFLLFPC